MKELDVEKKMKIFYLVIILRISKVRRYRDRDLF